MLTLLRVYYNDPYNVPIQLKTEDLDELVGQYSSDEMPLKISITKSGAVLLTQASEQPHFPLDAVSRNDFSREQFDVQLKLDREKHEMTLVQGGKSYKYIKAKQANQITRLCEAILNNLKLLAISIFPSWISIQCYELGVSPDYLKARFILILRLPFFMNLDLIKS